MEDGEEDEEDDDPYQLPISHEALLGSSHQKAVTCLDIDHSGSRLLTGRGLGLGLGWLPHRRPAAEAAQRVLCALHGAAQQMPDVLCCP